MVKELTLQDGTKVRVVGPPVEYSGSRNAVRSPPPSLGQHTVQVLSEVLNYSSSKIQKLKDNGDVL